MSCRPISRLAWAALLGLVTILVLPVTAWAHPLPGQPTGLGAGLAHPFSGLDHLAAMLAVGLWAAQLQGRAVWMLPLSFLSLMCLGGALGIAGVPLKLDEPLIAASVLVLGVLLATAIRVPQLAAAVLVGLFALFHGHAHGEEMPAQVAAIPYAIGFVSATAALHLTGLALGLSFRRAHRPVSLRWAGVAFSLVGVYLSLSWLCQA